MPHNICSDNENCNLPVVNFGKLVWLKDKLNMLNDWLNANVSLLEGKHSSTYNAYLMQHNTLVQVVNALSLPISLDLNKDRYVITL